MQTVLQGLDNEHRKIFFQLNLILKLATKNTNKH